jgi:hypothetical protein
MQNTTSNSTSLTLRIGSKTFQADFDPNIIQSFPSTRLTQENTSLGSSPKTQMREFITRTSGNQFELNSKRSQVEHN